MLQYEYHTHKHMFLPSIVFVRKYYRLCNYSDTNTHTHIKHVYIHHRVIHRRCC